MFERFGRLQPPIALLVASSLVLLAGSALALNLGVFVNSGDTAVSTITPEGDEDPFVFDAAEGGSFSAAVKRMKGSLLEPTIKLLSPDGEEMQISDSLKLSSKSAKLKNITLPVTGRYSVVVSGLNGTTGDYSLKVKGKPPKKLAAKLMVLAPGETEDFRFGGTVDAVLKLKVKFRTQGGGVEILDVSDPAGDPVTGWAQYLKSTSKGHAATFPLTGGFGDFTLTLGNAQVETTYDVLVKVKFPKPQKRKLTIPASEPRIDSVGSTASGKPFGVEGTEVALDGANFAPYPNEVTVWFGDNAATSYLLRREDRVVVRAPKGEGQVDVGLQNPDGNVAIARDAFTYVADPPSPEVVTPDRVPAAGGVVVTVTGQDLQFVEQVRLGSPRPDNSNVVDVQSVSNTQVTFTSPPFQPADQQVTLILIDTFGQESAFLLIRMVGVPDVAALDPAGGSFLGGNVVTVHGDNLDEENSYTVLLDGSDVGATFADPGWSFAAPPHAVGTVDVVVRDRWGQETVVPDAYEYNDGAFINETTGRMPKEDTGRSTRARDLVLVDVDNDSDEDLLLCREAVLTQFERLTKILLNDGSGKFTDVSETNLSGIHSDYSDFLNGTALAVGDLDGDNDPDLVVASESVFVNPESVPQVGKNEEFINTPYPSTRVFLNDGKGKFAQKENALPTVIPTTNTGTDVFQANALALGDVDGDDDLDIVIGRRSEPAVSILLYRSGYTWYGYKSTFATRYPPDEATTVISATRILLNNGQATFTKPTGRLPVYTAGDLLAADALLLGDLDGDDDPDLVLTVESEDARTPGRLEYVDRDKTGSQSKTRVFINNSSGTFSTETATFMPDPPGSMEDFSGLGLALGYINDDQYLDLVVVTTRDISFFDTSQPDNRRHAQRTRIFLGKAGGGFTHDTEDVMPSVSPAGTGVMFQGSTVAIGDINGDGHGDVVISGIEQVRDADGVRLNATRTLVNDGSGALVDDTVRRLPNAVYSLDDLRSHSVLLGDVDGDDDPDLLLGTELPVLQPTRVLIFK